MATCAEHSAAFPSEGEEEFFDSLDRVNSSSCSSTSASDSEEPERGLHQHRRRSSRRLSTCAFPVASVPDQTVTLQFSPSSAYEVWISEPTSVEERRRRLLISMGIISEDAPGEPLVDSLPSPSPSLQSSGNGVLYSTSHPVPVGRSVSWDEPLRCTNSDPDPNVHSCSVPRSRSEGSVSATASNSPSPCDEEIVGEICRIKNLDDGTEFEVKEVNVVKEVVTGRQLTMEEFAMSVGCSPIVYELMKRHKDSDLEVAPATAGGLDATSAPKPKKKGSWIRNVKSAAGNMVNSHRNSRNSKDNNDMSLNKGNVRRLSSTTDETTDGTRRLSSVSYNGPGRVRVKQWGKSQKELTGLFMTQEISAHIGAIWCIKFSLDGKYLASAGEDRIIHVWDVIEVESKGEIFGEGVVRDNVVTNPFLTLIGNGSTEALSSLGVAEGISGEKVRRTKMQNSRKSVSSDNLIVPSHVFGLAEKPNCSLKGHAEDVLDLSWSNSQHLLSSSMDKTVKLWDITSHTCLRTFSHSDYVTCIQFNPVDGNFFISGSLDEKVRIWSIPDRRIVDWNDLHEMVTAACYTPNGKGAYVGSHKGGCHLFDTYDSKLQYKSKVNLRIKKRKSGQKKITGFQFAPGSSSEVLITSADSRIRVLNGDELVHKFKGFRNTSSQISASIGSNGKHVICASEDSHIYVWRHDFSRPRGSKEAANVTQSYEHFYCRGVTVATTWPGKVAGESLSLHRVVGDHRDKEEPSPENNELYCILPSRRNNTSPHHDNMTSSSSNSNGDDGSSVMHEEKLLSGKETTEGNNSDLTDGSVVQVELQRRSAWGLVIVTAGRGGEIRIFQNFGLPVHV